LRFADLKRDRIYLTRTLTETQTALVYTKLYRDFIVGRCFLDLGGAVVHVHDTLTP
jgi:hypothetical protein